MLGLGTNSQNWSWHAVGKHPAAADYIFVRNGPVILDALGDWMTKGYDALHRGGHATQGPYAWRFWLRGGHKNRLICGVGRDSSDRIGRPYPLLILGEGPLPRWESQWTALPARLARTWSRIERIVVRRYEALSELADAVCQLPSPADDGVDAPAAEIENTVPGRLDSCRATLRQTGRAMISLSDTSGGEADDQALKWHARLAYCCTEIPRAVFLGGNSRDTFLAVFLRPLNTDDFIHLWSV